MEDKITYIPAPSEMRNAVVGVIRSHFSMQAILDLEFDHRDLRKDVEAIMGPVDFHNDENLVRIRQTAGGNIRLQIELVF